MRSASRTAVHRVRRRVLDFLDNEKHKPMARRVTQASIARDLGDLARSTVHGLLKGDPATQGALSHLDALAEIVGMSPAELVQGYNSTLVEASKTERWLIALWRSWPPAVQAHFFRLHRFLGDLLPEELAHREYLMLLRELEDEGRAQALGDLRDAVHAARRARSARSRANALAGPNLADETAESTQKRRAPE